LPEKDAVTPLLPENYPYRGVRITPGGAANRARVIDAVGVAIPIGRTGDLLVSDNTVEEFEVFQARSPRAVRAWKEVWCLDDAVPWPDPDRAPELAEYGGQRVNLTGDALLGGYAHIFLYDDRDSALAVLARFYDRLGLVWAVWQSGAGPARAIARTILDGDEKALPVLADALEEAGDPRAAEVRAWLKKARPKGRARGKRSP
jgi:hypothetical protein